MDAGVRMAEDLSQLAGVLGSEVVPTKVIQFPVELIQNEITGAAVAGLLQTTFSSYLSADWDTCVQLCDALLDLTWEKLNTGHWKDVPVSWRHLYTIVSWIKALGQFATSSVSQRSSMVKEAIRTCDIGLLMGAPVLDNVLTRLVSRMQAFYSDKRKTEDRTESEPDDKKPRFHDAPDITKPVPVVSNPSLEYFRTEHMIPEEPVLIENAMDYWPAMGVRRWSVGYIRQLAGCRTVPVEVGSKYTEDDWSQTLMTVDEFIDSYIEAEAPSGGKGYLAQHQLFDQIPELRRDIHVPSYCGLGDGDGDSDVDINAWFGPAGTVSPLHHDPKHNLLCQVVGEKYVRLYSAQYTDMLYPHDGRLFANTSRVDVDKPDLASFPDFAKALYVECILRPGQMLYIPPKCWHYVRALSVSFSVSFWWL